eukprot:TRINITY_DN7697_c0_g1_i2.p2 TRINITY_DN7697_c0_g1~~TRINITY_DN7697_c0_g1_i2.p2  ORF type:complete len:181 (-),score=20.44 TRINITY_DN7697_c0_g1_i2:535-1041(-)
MMTQAVSQNFLRVRCGRELLKLGTASRLHRLPRSVRISIRAQDEEKKEVKLEDTEEQQELDMEALVRENRGKKARSERPKVVSPVVEQVYGDKEQTPAQKNETLIVTGLLVLALIILIEGVFLAASGFFSDEVDQFAQNVIYPAFSPTVLLLLAGSTVYGLWKSRQQQ